MTVALMIQGTTSDAGKSLVVTALCRILWRRGVRVAPFKPQNMALNSAVTVEGGEIGRAQAVQAAACGLEPRVDMNPVLLKPNSDRGSQVIVLGHPVADLDARAYHHLKPQLMPRVLAAFHRLGAEFDAVVVEGAGSPAEINLRDRDIANMGFAEASDCPVVIVGDIDRGGVFAQFIGTLELLTPDERERVHGFIINRFRGDVALLQPGVDWLQKKTGKPVLGILPFLPSLYLAAEDSFFDEPPPVAAERERIRVVVPRLPRMSNHTDFDPLRLHPGVALFLVKTGQPIPPADLIILPGSKSVSGDLAWLRQQGWPEVINQHLRYGGRLIGICGGFQMLGERLEDPLGLEGPAGGEVGLGLLPMTTRYQREKSRVNTRGRLAWGAAAVAGYEIHRGQSTGPAIKRPALFLADVPHGACSEDGRIFGHYLHGIFDHPEGCRALLSWAGLVDPQPLDLAKEREAAFDRLADAFEAHVDLAPILGLLQVKAPA